MTDGPGYISVFTSAPDGLTLHARDYGERTWDTLPVVCLAGLTRNGIDFDPLARALSGDASRPRRVVALDYRGRGLSDRDPDWQHYDVKIEAGDVLAQLVALGIAEALFVGTSRGGLVTMVISAIRPAIIRGVVLNDIGPVIEPQGLMRIRATVGKLPSPASWTEAAEILKALSVERFPALDDADWLAMAQGTWRELNGSLVLSYDPALMRALAGFDLEAPMPDLWPLFQGLSSLPILLLRGQHSDLLSDAGAAAMKARHQTLEFMEVPGQGHAPLLRDAATMARIAAFVNKVENIERPV